VGAVVSAGGGTTGGAVTTALGAERADLDPAAFDAVTTTRMVWPTSLEAMTYVDCEAPATATHVVPALLQSCHR
jgi:hypothetical protein